MKEYIKMFKMYPYCLKFKSQVIMLLIFFAIGLLLEFTDMQFLADLYIALPGLFFIQMGHNLLVSDVVKSSPYQYKLEVKLPTFVSAVIMSVAYFACSGILFIKSAVIPGYELVGSRFLFIGGMISLLLIYCGYVYKYFWFGMLTIIPMLGAFSGYLSFNEAAGTSFFLTYTGFSPIISFIIGYVLVILGVVIEHILLRLLYKKPYSKYAFGAILKKA